MTNEILKEKLINKIKQIEDPVLLQEASVLFELQESESVYNLTEEQKSIIEKARGQIKNNDSISNESNTDAEQWLKE